MYYLTIKTTNKNAKRHIAGKSKDIDYLKNLCSGFATKYIVEICNGSWETIWRRGEDYDKRN